MPNSQDVQNKEKDDFSFEDALRRLQEIVAELEATDFNLDEALASYEQGVLIAKECLVRLEAAELRIKELRLNVEDGT
ncbi:MAG: exodeoxyribonuclease VII small subunit [Rhodothermales bacterium]|nr:exodeoxyribonuclease VII small subunit [Rhodothermales bacterium]